SSVVLLSPLATFSPYTTFFRSAYAGAAFGHKVVVGDFDEDGALDLVTGGSNGTAICFHQGLGDGTFSPKGCPGPNAQFFNGRTQDRKSTRLNSSHVKISYADSC